MKTILNVRINEESENNFVFVTENGKELARIKKDNGRFYVWFLLEQIDRRTVCRNFPEALEEAVDAIDGFFGEFGIDVEFVK